MLPNTGLRPRGKCVSQAGHVRGVGVVLIQARKVAPEVEPEPLRRRRLAGRPELDKDFVRDEAAAPRIALCLDVSRRERADGMLGRWGLSMARLPLSRRFSIRHSSPRLTCPR
jgi:hypothetical protein